MVCHNSRFTKVALNFFLLFFFFSSFLHASDEAIPRKVLAFYEEELLKTPFQSNVHRRAEVVLNHLGLEVIHRPIEAPLPTDGELQGVRGIITWFRKPDAVAHPSSYCLWLNHQMERGLKVVVLGEMGVVEGADRKLSQACQQTFLKMGVENDGFFSENPLYFEIKYKNSEWVEFERKLNLTEGLKYSWWKLKPGFGKSYLQVARRDLENSASDLVVTTPMGGLVHPSYSLYWDVELRRAQWRINPFLFFEEAFGLQGLPRPDTTTINGSRIYYSHIDGDGIFNVSEVDNKSYAGEIILEEIIKKNPDLPITVGLITGYFDMPSYFNNRTKKLYQNLASLPQVEIASHGYAHPLVWSKGTVALQIPGYSFNAEKETSQSLNQLNDWLERWGFARKAKLFQWTGDSLPTVNAMRALENSGALNINGGDSRFDRQYNSYAFLAPLGIVREGMRQIYSSASNENVYTNLWQGPYYGFRDLEQTIQNTERPIRIKPIDIYYHFYSGEKVASLKVLKELMVQAFQDPLFPIFAREFSQIARDFFKVEISRQGSAFVVEQTGSLRTLRFDHEKRNLDLNQSEGVLGFNHDREALYVFLDESKTHRMVLTSQKPSRPYLQKSTFTLLDFKAQPSRITFKKQGWRAGYMELAGLAPHRFYRINSPEGSEVLQANEEGILTHRFRTSENGGSPTEVEITRELP